MCVRVDYGCVCACADEGRFPGFILVMLNERLFTQFTLNVVADLLFFSCFSLIIMHTAENSFKTTVGDTKSFNSVVAWVFLAINVSCCAS